MGFMTAMGNCLRCHCLFSFNPERVPSMRITPESPKEPLCKSCFEILNAKRQQAGLPPWPLDPNAYGAEEVA